MVKKIESEPMSMAFLSPVHWKGIVCGVDLTSDCFLLGTVMFFRRNVNQYESTPLVKTLTQYSEFYAYNLDTNILTKSIKINGNIFYRALRRFKSKGGLSKIEEKYLYDDIINNNFVRRCLLTSDYM